MHLAEQYKSENKKNDSLWKSYDMIYNLKKYKMCDEFMHVEEEDLDEKSKSY